MQSSAEDTRAKAGTKILLNDQSDDHKPAVETGESDVTDKTSGVGSKFDLDKLNNMKKETNPEQSNTLSSDLYDPDIAEICLGTFDGEKGKSNGSDTSLTEMTGSVESETNTSQENNNNGNSDKDTISVIKIEDDDTNKVADSRKRSLSPNTRRNTSGETESKRFRYASGNMHVSSSNQPDTTHAETVDIPTENHLPIAVVAPLGFSEDLFIDTPILKDEKDGVNEAKHDIASLLDSFGNNDDKTLTLFDAEFDKIKSDILSSQSFKTLDGNQWTFDLPTSGFDNLFKCEPTKGNVNPKQNQNDGVKKYSEESQQKKQFQRQPSVEHDILDFEKVLNNVMQKGSQNIKVSKSDQESMPTKLQYTLPRSSVASSQCNQSAHQPCQHVANSDLLRELLDQKTETTSAQAKRRQEIDLSFLQPDVVAGKGLSVSSDKILQTRTIDPRLTSKPYVERSRNSAQFSAVSSSAVFSKSVSCVTHTSSAVVSNTVVPSTNVSMMDPISLAEQRRASITLHHKVPPYDITESSVTSTDMTNDEQGSNIIKEAFDFATEISDTIIDNARSTNPPPLFDSRLIGSDGMVNSQSRSMFTNEQQGRPQSDFIPEGFRHNKAGPVFNRRMMGNSQQPDMNANALLMKLEETNPINFDQSRGIRPNSVEHVSSMPRSQIDFQSVAPHSKSPGFPNLASNMSLNGGHGGYPMEGDMRGLQRNTSMPSHVDSQFRMDAIQSQSIMGEKSFNPSNMQRYMPTSNMNTSDRSQLASMMQQRNQQKLSVTPPMGHPYSGMSQTGHAMSQQGQPMRGSMNGPDLLQVATEDPLQARLSDQVSAGRGGMGSMRPDTGLQIGMQERIRAMNVQQWYRRRMQTQMNRFPQQQQMMPRPGMGQTGFPSQDSVRPQFPGQESVRPQFPGQESVRPQFPGQESVRPQFPGQESLRHQYVGQESVRPQSHAPAMNKHHQNANIGMQRYGFPSGQVQGQSQYQNTIGQGQSQGQMSYQQYIDQRTQRINNTQMQNQMRMSRGFNVGSSMENTGSGGLDPTQFPDSIPDFDTIKPQSHVSQGSDMFPFNI